MTRDELIDYLIEEADYTFQELKDESNKELFDRWLEWNGICGWTDDIVNMVFELWEIDEMYK